jgi:hypothetical protein
MTQQAAGYEDFDIPLESGRLWARRWDAADAPAVVCVPGLSANLCGFDRSLRERTARALMDQCSRLSGHDNPTAVISPGHWRGHGLTVGLACSWSRSVLTRQRLPDRVCTLTDPCSSRGWCSVRD